MQKSPSIISVKGLLPIAKDTYFLSFFLAYSAKAINATPRRSMVEVSGTSKKEAAGRGMELASAPTARKIPENDKIKKMKFFITHPMATGFGVLKLMSPGKNIQGKIYEKTTLPIRLNGI